MKCPRLLAPLAASLALSPALPAKLVSHYQFDDPGAVGRDDGAFALDGTPVDGAQYSTDSRLGGGALRLDGNGGHVNLGGAGDFSGLDDDGDGFTLTAWIKPDSLSGVRRIFSTGMFNGFQGTGWGAGMSGASLFGTTYGIRDFNADSNDLAPGVWQHVAYVFRPASGQLRFYLDGAFVTTRSGATGMNNTGLDFIIGGIALPGNGQWFQGHLDDLRIYDTELSFAEISALANPVDIRISSFHTTNSPLPAPGITTLAWSVEGADSVTLDGGPFSNESVPAFESGRLVTVGETTTFTLTATTGGVSVSRNLTVAVTTGGREPFINEFVATNATGLPDEDGDRSDWIELWNDNPFDHGLAGWFLTDDPADLTKWEFPAASIPAGGYRLIFASGKDRTTVGSEWHTNFRLAAAGEYLALVRPDGTVAREFSPTYPPQLQGYSYGLSGSGESYFAPTPGAANGTALASLPPIISGVTENPPQPLASEDLVIRATILATGAEIGEVDLHYRINFDNEVVIPMSAGTGGSYQALIPATAFDGADMVRWFVTARSEGGPGSRLPVFDDPIESAEYFGTVVTDPDIETDLPVLHWFVQNESASLTRTGTQASLFYRGEFYDNVYCRIRGQSAAGWPKHKFKFDFYRGGKFRFDPAQPRVEEFNLQSFYREVFGQSSNTSYMREPLMFKWMRDNGVAAPECFHLQVRRNGGFYGLFAFVEQIDDDFLERFGFDPDGEMYKATWQAGGPATLAPNPVPGQYRKATAKNEPWTNFQDFCAGINSANRSPYVWDHVDLAQWINCLATMNVPFNHDQLTKNYYVYREPESGEWHRFPWDADQSFPVGQYITGENWTNPLYGDDNHTQELSGGRPNPAWRNRMHDAIMDDPVMREMYLRRVKTLADQGLAGRNGGPSYFEEQVELYRQALVPDAAADRNYWATQGFSLSAMQAGVDEILDTALPRRRTHLFETYAADGPVPLLPPSEPTNPAVSFGAIEYQPASGNQDEEFIEIQNPEDFAIDLSHWTVEGGVRHIFPPGTVLAAGQSLFLSPDVATFRQRSASPTGGESRFVQGPYGGHLSNLGELLVIRDAQGGEVVSTTTPVDPSVHQQFLVISEIMYHPADDSDAEFVELMNISDTVTLDLGGVSFTDGIEFAFPSGTSLAPGARIVVPLADFANGSRLNNAGETIKLEGPDGATVQEFSYDDEAPWPLAADGAGASLVLRDPESRPDPGDPGSWRPSPFSGGSPGGDDRLFFSGDADNDQDGDGMTALLEHALGSSDQSADPAPLRLIPTPDGFALTFTKNLAAGDVSIVIESSSDLDHWNDVTDAVRTIGPYRGDGRQDETWTLPPTSDEQGFLRLKVMRR